MVHSSVRVFVACIAAVSFAGTALVGAAQSDDAASTESAQQRPMYQRRAFEPVGGYGNRHHGRHAQRAWQAPPVNAGWFQRPYPYHLDYYRMRYSGSYAPYFGNLYGPPQVVTAPPYYGPYYGGFGSPIGSAFNGGYGETAPHADMTNGTVSETPLPTGQNEESLPMPPQ